MPRPLVAIADEHLEARIVGGNRVFENCAQRVHITMPVPLKVGVVGAFGAGIFAAWKIRPELGLGIEIHQFTRQPQRLLIAGQHVPVGERARRVPLMVNSEPSSPAFSLAGSSVLFQPRSRR